MAQTEHTPTPTESSVEAELWNEFEACVSSFGPYAGGHLRPTVMAAFFNRNKHLIDKKYGYDLYTDTTN